jgi:hypothetical protein
MLISLHLSFWIVRLMRKLFQARVKAGLTLFFFLKNPDLAFSGSSLVHCHICGMSYTPETHFHFLPQVRLNCGDDFFASKCCVPCSLSLVVVRSGMNQTGTYS